MVILQLLFMTLGPIWPSGSSPWVFEKSFNPPLDLFIFNQIVWLVSASVIFFLYLFFFLPRIEVFFFLAVMTAPCRRCGSSPACFLAASPNPPLGGSLGYYCPRAAGPGPGNQGLAPPLLSVLGEDGPFAISEGIPPFFFC